MGGKLNMDNKDYYVELSKQVINSDKDVIEFRRELGEKKKYYDWYVFHSFWMIERASATVLVCIRRSRISEAPGKWLM